LDGAAAAGAEVAGTAVASGAVVGAGVAVAHAVRIMLAMISNPNRVIRILFFFIALLKLVYLD
jgi:hypothetical protein